MAHLNSFYEPFGPRVSEYKDIINKLDKENLSLESMKSFQELDPDPLLSSNILDHYQSQREEKRIAIFKLQILQKISRAINIKCKSQVLLTGSTLNGFGGQGSDLDLTIIPDAYIWDATCFIFFLRDLLQHFCGFFIMGEMEVVRARVPILKFWTRRAGYPSIHVDLSINNINSVRNTHLLYCYSQLDSRVRPLVLAVKKWARDCEINDASDNTLSSYALTLMVVFFLQAGVSPPVLPCLQETQPAMFPPESHPDSLVYSAPQSGQSGNTQSLSHLYLQFFQFYSLHTIQRNDSVISVRTGGYISKEKCKDFSSRHRIGPGQWNANLLIEDPFDRTNVARAVYCDKKWSIILSSLADILSILAAVNNDPSQGFSMLESD